MYFIFVNQHLDKSPIMDDITLEDRLSALQQISQKKLIQILDGIGGKKDLIIEQKLMKILDSFIGVTELK